MITFQRLLFVVLVLTALCVGGLGIANYRATLALEEKFEASLRAGAAAPVEKAQEGASIAAQTVPAPAIEPVAERDYIQAPSDIISPTDVERAAARASQLTGVRKEFLMGAMTVETMLGQNVGQCTYQEVAEGAKASHARGQLSGRSWETFLSRKEQIETLAQELGYEVESLKVSCNPNPSQYVGTGGAMGVAQFMPSTWYEYRERLREVSGKEHPDPWNVEDSVLAMALKLGDVPGVSEHDLSAEKRASQLYLSGSVSAKYEWYANDIQYWADNHHEILGEQYIYDLLFQ